MAGGGLLRRVSLVFVLVILAAVDAQARLQPSPEITSVFLDPTDSGRIAIRIDYLPCEAAVSTNAGVSFVAVTDQDVPSAWTTNLTAGTRRYALEDSFWLFRSDDSGVTWTNTGAASFLREQSQAAIEQEEEWFREDYGSRLPQRSALWHPLFGAFACAHVLLCFRILRQDGSLRAILIGLRALVVLMLVWALLCGIHTVVMHWTESQYPLAYWNTSARSWPSPKLGLVMAIAARPLALFPYLLFLWPVLPGSTEMLGHLFTERRRRVAMVLSVVAGTALAVFHLCMMLVGYFFE